MMHWLSKQPSWKKARNVQISTSTFGLSPVVLLPSNDEDPLNDESRKISYLPNVDETYAIWYKYRWVQVTRIQEQTGYYGRMEETLRLRILSRSNEFLNDILRDAKRQYMAAQENNISIYVSDTSNSWRHVASRPKRSLQSIILDPGLKDLLIGDARDFLESKEWYADRGIPFRRGYLLYGAPGSGKTSLIHSLAGELGLDVYIISLSRTGLDDSGLSTLITELPEKCIALMEDIDAAFHHGLSRENDVSDEGSTEGVSKDKVVAAKAKQNIDGPTPNRISLSGLLNALDGIGAQEGRILFATTNKYTSLDPALCRPGRMDLHIEFKLASKYQAEELFKRFYLPPSERNGSGKAEVKVEDDEKSSLDSGFSDLSSGSSSDLIDLGGSGTTSPDFSEKESQVHATPALHRKRAPKLTHCQASKLAAQFSDAIPDRAFSMAALQGYLMTYKTRPYEAVNEFASWMAKERVGTN
ncbi:hypothetical protein SERLADRAFT_473328 [Serpula lacrymans var. lacrymans S7.9]|uniref:AAA+ ATPase domain-containing protein n=1 Tax=Serpula lacrymans var. lacrymans (strain S7.9) TaxID=578457 RepID=F8P2T3_SERL9|nr:uncharacterized protein SERLADRAFT_473328 [Serpula lacrymans var. lacrymans S7.9]EGO22468.1 hypothetical protein SERLADRAFT_473328 [Serpula lacrymans var. lacrymans S7.9]